MTRLVPRGCLALLLAGLAACASESPSGAATSPAQPSPGRLDPVNDFPQSRGGNSYMRQ